MPKSSKKFIIMDESVNEFGFRFLVDGVDLTQYEKNPVLLWMHNRAWRGTKDEVLPLGYMTELAKEDGKITGVPYFDDNDEFAMSIYNKVESGVLRMCSVGAKVLEESQEPSLILQGQIYATITKSAIGEVSIVDIGANNNSLALYNHKDEMITLSSKTDMSHLLTPINKDMKKEKLQALALQLGLKEDADEDAVILKVANLQEKVVQLAASEQATKSTSLVTLAIQQGKISESEKEAYITLANKDYETTAKLLNEKKAYVSLNGRFSKEDSNADDVTLAWSWDDFQEKDPSGNKLLQLKSSNPDRYTKLFNAKYKN